jgi:hypothetical protein
MRTALLAASLVVTYSGTAAAQSSEKDKEIAETLFMEGNVALDRRQTELACIKFRSSMALFPVLNSRANVAQCDEREGKLVEALEIWQKLVPEFVEGDERLKAAKERIVALELRIPQLTLVLDEVPASATILVDNAAVDRALISSPLKLAKGEHAIVVQVAGRNDLRQTIVLAEGDRREIRITPGKLLTQDSTSPNSRRTAAFVIGGVGLASAVMAGITGGLIVSNDGQVQKGCRAGVNGTTECTAGSLQLIQDVKPLMAVNGIAWGVGLAGVGLGTILFISSGKSVSNAAFAPLVLPGGGGASLTGRF